VTSGRYLSIGTAPFLSCSEDEYTMKIRNGFVSNSSSASFIAKSGLTTTETTLGFAKAMLEIYKNKYPKLFMEENKWIKIHISELETAIPILERNKWYDKPYVIKFTCNYETFIYRNQDPNSQYMTQVCIDTCSNENWCGYKDAMNIIEESSIEEGHDTTFQLSIGISKQANAIYDDGQPYNHTRYKAFLFSHCTNISDIYTLIKIDHIERMEIDTIPHLRGISNEKFVMEQTSTIDDENIPDMPRLRG